MSLEELAQIFGSEDRSSRAAKVLDNVVMCILIVNAATLYASTFYSLQEAYGSILLGLDFCTTVLFLIEVSIRIWAVGVVQERYAGLWGRVKYCFTPVGIIDFVSTYPALVCGFWGLSPNIVKSLRIVRLLRIFRFVKAFKLLSNAMASKRTEMLLSLGVLTVVTFMLSVILFFVEHDAGDAAFASGWEAVTWAFLQYIGDPGSFADFKPVTYVGRVIASLIGVLGIAVFAVPAGLIGSGFIEEVEKIKEARKNNENHDKIISCYDRKLCRITGFRPVPHFQTINTIKVLTGLTEDEILKAVKAKDDLRLVNLAKTELKELKPQDRLAVEHYLVNRPYGFCLDRGSDITIVDTSSFSEPCMGNFAFYIAMIGGFNFISRELGSLTPPKSYYNYPNEESSPHLGEFMDDLEALTKGENKWAFYMLASSGGEEPDMPTQIHLNYGGKKGDETYDDKENITIHDTDHFERFFQSFSAQAKEEFGLLTDKQRFYNTTNRNNIMHHLAERCSQVNSVSFRIKWYHAVDDGRRMAIAKAIADNMNRSILEKENIEYDPDLTSRDTGFAGYSFVENQNDEEDDSVN